MKDGVGPLSASQDSVLAWVTGLKPRKLTHTVSSLLHTYECFFFNRNRSDITTVVLPINTCCSQWKTHTHRSTEFPVSGLSHSPNHSVTPPLLGSSFCLCLSSSMNFSCISSMEPSAAARSFTGKMSGKVKVWPWAWDARVKEKKKRKMSKENHHVTT